MADEARSHWIAEEARKTFIEIRELRKTMPIKFAHERKALDEAIKKKQDEWWARVGPIMRGDSDEHGNI